MMVSRWVNGYKREGGQIVLYVMLAVVVDISGFGGRGDGVNRLTE
jgi:hypothetical protein